MTFFDEIIKKIFGGQTNPQNLQHKQLLKRSEKEKRKYLLWLESAESTELLARVKKAYHYRKSNIPSDVTIDIFRSASANGFAISQEKGMDKRTLPNLMDYFREKVLNLNYRQQSATRKISDKGSYVHIEDKYYLKPSIRLQAQNQDVCNQLYGNVLLEQISIDNEPYMLKVLVTHYQDRLFTKVLDYDEFVSKIFD